MLKVIRFVFYLEMILLMRRSQEWLYPLGFFFIVVSLFPLAFTPDALFFQKYFSGCVWIAALLASLLAIENIFSTDIEDGHLEQLLLCPIPLVLLVLIKVSARWVVTALPLILLTPILGLLFHLSFMVTVMLSATLLLGTPILTLIGSLGAALTLGLRQQGVLLGIIMLPLVTPILIFGVSIMQQYQAGFSIAGPIAFLSGLFILALTLLPISIAASLRISIDM